MKKFIFIISVSIIVIMFSCTKKDTTTGSTTGSGTTSTNTTGSTTSTIPDYSGNYYDSTANGCHDANNTIITKDKNNNYHIQGVDYWTCGMTFPLTVVNNVASLNANYSGNYQIKGTGAFINNILIMDFTNSYVPPCSIVKQPMHRMYYKK